jgi:2,4-dienoyl-CoA reductase-like NADH-dependent reductase (Old Yellow Enzyme family)
VLLKFAATESGGRLGRRLSLEDGVALARIFEQAGFDALTPVAASVLPNTAICRGGYPGQTFENASMRRRLRESASRPWHLQGTRLAMWLAARRYPFEPVWNRRVFAAVKQAVSIPVFAVGGIRTPEEAAAILSAGEADLIGIGRPFYAEPDLAQRFLAAGEDGLDAPLACESCNRCIVPQMLGMPGVCYNPAVNKKRAAIRAAAEERTAAAAARLAA